MRVSGAACAAAVLLVAEGLDHDWVVQCACRGCFSLSSSSSLVPVQLLRNPRGEASESRKNGLPHTFTT